jgi:hypothetical protein
MLCTLVSQLQLRRSVCTSVTVMDIGALSRDLQLVVVSKLDMDGRRKLGLVHRLHLPKDVRARVEATLPRIVDHEQFCRLPSGGDFLTLVIPPECPLYVTRLQDALAEDARRSRTRSLKVVMLTARRLLRGTGQAGPNGTVLLAHCGTDQSSRVSVAVFEPPERLDTSIYVLCTRPLWPLGRGF